MGRNDTNKELINAFFQAIIGSTYETDQFLVFECDCVPNDIDCFTEWCKERLLAFQELYYCAFPDRTSSNIKEFFDDFSQLFPAIDGPLMPDDEWLRTHSALEGNGVMYYCSENYIFIFVPHPNTVLSGEFVRDKAIKHGLGVCDLNEVVKNGKKELLTEDLRSLIDF